MNYPIKLKKDRQTVTSEGDPVEAKIDGLVIRHARPIEDKRGDITEVYNPAWGLSEDPVVYAYHVTIRPGAIRGWEMHEKQTDRIFISQGVMRWALYDMRPESPTFQKLNVFVISELNRCLMIVPTGIMHAVQNIGNKDAIFFNLPTCPYNHADPDKYRPIDPATVPFDFDDPPGW